MGGLVAFFNSIFHGEKKKGLMIQNATTRNPSPSSLNLYEVQLLYHIFICTQVHDATVLKSPLAHCTHCTHSPTTTTTMFEEEEEEEEEKGGRGTHGVHYEQTVRGRGGGRVHLYQEGNFLDGGAPVSLDPPPHTLLLPRGAAAAAAAAQLHNLR